MKLLFDQNLSPRLPQLLADIYPASVHIREIGLRDAEDVLIWEYAKAHGFAVVSKDSDFQQRSLLTGAPPKFMRRHSAAIHTFDLDDTKSHLILP